MEKAFGVMVSLYRGTPGHGEWVVACLQGAWPKLVGERLASVCRPAAFERRTLRIEVLDSQWQDAVKSVGPELLDKLRAATSGEVDQISVVMP